MTLHSKREEVIVRGWISTLPCNSEEFTETDHLCPARAIHAFAPICQRCIKRYRLTAARKTHKGPQYSGHRSPISLKLSMLLSLQTACNIPAMLGGNGPSRSPAGPAATTSTSKRQSFPTVMANVYTDLVSGSTRLLCQNSRPSSIERKIPALGSAQVSGWQKLARPTPSKSEQSGKFTILNEIHTLL